MSAAVNTSPQNVLYSLCFISVFVRSVKGRWYHALIVPLGEHGQPLQCAVINLTARKERIVGDDDITQTLSWFQHLSMFIRKPEYPGLMRLNLI